MTKHQQLIIIHHDYLQPTTNISPQITQFNYHQIKHPSPPSSFGQKFKHQHFPTFDDLLKIANQYNINLNLELKPITG
ncbi:glycerophosphodiester phosphodiesterase family protein, partial [Staphylococcus epidermidis]|uniref:glycerophosphodiester phosphodiesterase family protein n=1 Tax=Staphylococcus epidermidis TaxID=1282 RepID=UPI0037DA30A3